jgi:hypothetical protein
MTTSPFDNPARVHPPLRDLLCSMLSDPRPAYAAAAAAAAAGLDDGTLLGLLASADRGRITAWLRGVVPAEARGGALFQCIELASPPRSGADLPGWILVADDYGGGALVLAHEIAHYRNRLVVHLEARQPAPLVDLSLASGLPDAAVRGVRASFLNEVAARHTAYLAQEGASPATRLPEPGALFACAVKIAQYPEVYNDCGLMRRLLSRGDDDLLRDQVGLWLEPLAAFSFFEPGPLEAAHRAYLVEETSLAAAGRAAPRVPAEGTLLAAGRIVLAAAGR